MRRSASPSRDQANASHAGFSGGLGGARSHRVRLDQDVAEGDDQPMDVEGLPLIRGSWARVPQAYKH